MWKCIINFKICRIYYADQKSLVEILADNTCRSIQEVEKAMSYGKIMSADEAVSFGICDKIIERI